MYLFILLFYTIPDYQHDVRDRGRQKNDNIKLQILLPKSNISLNGGTERMFFSDRLNFALANPMYNKKSLLFFHRYVYLQGTTCEMHVSVAEFELIHQWSLSLSSSLTSSAGLLHDNAINNEHYL